MKITLLSITTNQRKRRGTEDFVEFTNLWSFFCKNFLKFFRKISLKNHTEMSETLTNDDLNKKEEEVVDESKSSSSESSTSSKSSEKKSDAVSKSSKSSKSDKSHKSEEHKEENQEENKEEKQEESKEETAVGKVKRRKPVPRNKINTRKNLKEKKYNWYDEFTYFVVDFWNDYFGECYLIPC